MKRRKLPIRPSILENTDVNSVNPTGTRAILERSGVRGRIEGRGRHRILQTGLVAQMKEKNFVHVEGDVTVKLADSHGFCWGVERAVQMCYEARKQYPTEKMWII